MESPLRRRTRRAQRRSGTATASSATVRSAAAAAWFALPLALASPRSVRGDRQSLELVPSQLWCWATPRYQREEGAGAIWRQLGADRRFRADVHCCSLDKVKSVLEYAEAVLDFKLNTMEQQREFADGVTQGLGRSSAENPCHAVVAGSLRRRVDALLSALALQGGGFRRIRRVLKASLAVNCLLPRSPSARASAALGLRREASAMGGILDRLGAIASELDRGEQGAWRSAEEQQLQACLPAPAVASLAGAFIPPPPPQTARLRHDLRYPFSVDVADVRTWHMWTDRFALVLSRLVGKLGYQMKVITSSFEPTFLQGSKRAIFWARDLLLQAEDTPRWRWPNYDASVRSRADESLASLALVVHVSNRTAPDVVEAAWEEVSVIAETTDRLKVLFVEDSLRDPWVTNVRPEHAAELAHRARLWRRSQRREREPRCGVKGTPSSSRQGQSDIEVVWRRHQATLRHDVVAAMSLEPALEASAGALVLDLRLCAGDAAAAACPRAAPNAAFQGLRPSLVKVFRSRALGRSAAGDGSFGQALRFLPAAELRQLAAPFGKLRASGEDDPVLGAYVQMHRSAVAAWPSAGSAADADADAGTASGGELRGPRALVYVCNPFSLCGGHGDRANGLLSAFALAILTDRAFFIDSDSPLPLGLLLQPRRGTDGAYLVDWRLRGGAVGVGSQNFYLDDRVAFQADLGWLVRDPSPVLLVSMNLRELGAILRHPLLRRKAQALGLFDAPDLISRLWDCLFEPTPVLLDRLQTAAAELRLSGPLPWLAQPLSPAQEDDGFIGIHFRAGNESARLWWDPGRHAIALLPAFLACAARAEEELRLPRTTKWFLSADARNVLTAPPVEELRRRGKLVTLGDEWHLAHVDRSHISHGLLGFADSYTAYFLLASARAIVLSRSYFGETAAEVGAVPNAYFAEGCVRTDLRSS
eukprot:TRINITY_DN55159_c0_g1_i1.p1 TRINITY_DN55159_c0_g1~~TRINITY_DN55159_c0_g1_i1.p1  ORF type:complete len:955 (+),score=213.24 TRINITY_DN55159_c0_g1_i1:72-2867(+)